MLTGLNHLTLAVRELSPSLAFYEGVLGLRLHACWDHGAYLTLGGLWLCLSLDDQPEPARGYTHYAFSVALGDSPPLPCDCANTGSRNGGPMPAKATRSTFLTLTDTDWKPTLVTSPPDWRTVGSSLTTAWSSLTEFKRIQSNAKSGPAQRLFRYLLNSGLCRLH